MDDPGRGRKVAGRSWPAVKSLTAADSSMPPNQCNIVLQGGSTGFYSLADAIYWSRYTVLTGFHCA